MNRAVVGYKLRPNGDLEVCLHPDALDEDEREELLGRGDDVDALLDLLEHDRCNGGPYPTDAGSLYRDGIQCLTDAPFIATGEERPDSGHVGYWGTLWWFPGYLLENPVATLIRDGHVVFSRGIVLGEPVDCEACRRGGDPDGQPTGNKDGQGWCARTDEDLCPVCRGRGFTLREYEDEDEWRRKTQRVLGVKEA